MTNLASPFHRLLGYIIDVLIGWAITSTIFVLLSSPTTAMGVLDNILTALIIFLIAIFVLPLVVGLIVSRLGGSPGKLLSGLAIVNDKNQHISFWRALFRTYVGYTVSSIFLGLGFIWIFIDKQRRGWHDQISDTYVVVTHSAGLATGLIALVALVVFNYWLIKTGITNFVEHRSTYVQLIDNIKSDFPSPTPKFIYNPNPIPPGGPAGFRRT